MVSSEKVWDPIHVGLFQSNVTNHGLTAGLKPQCNKLHCETEEAAATKSQQPTLLSLQKQSSATLDTCRSVQALTLQPINNTVCYREEDEGGVTLSEMKAKRHGGRGEVVMEDSLEDMPDGPKNAKITLSFPLSAAPVPLSLTSPNHCRSSSSSSSPSPQRRRQTSKCSDEGALWKLDSTTDVKHRPFKPPRPDSSPSSSPSSSSSPMTVHTLKSPPPLKCSKLSTDTQFHRSPPRSSSGALEGCYGGDVWDERHKLANGAASQTAQILFSLGSAYNRPGDTERREKMTRRPAGKLGSPHGPNLSPPPLHLPPPLPPPPPSEGLVAPPHPSSYPSSDSLKPELICGVCHRLFSSAASLTVHMRLHRGSRGLSCRYCGKAFIHSKRLHSHEASCRVPGLPPSLGPPSLTMQPKDEPLEEGEVRVEGGVIVGPADITKARSGKKAQSLLAQIQSDDAAAAELLAGDENHFVKVVDGNVIYFCSVCERSYMTLSSLKRHSNVHSWRRKYPCHYCDKVFALAEYRTKHEVWHTGERRYQCIFCWDAFATYYNLKTHQKTIHGINPSLISSEKTANGGYKQKANALKLYRLLPMRSQKRPYKTYNDSLHNGLLLPPADAASLPVPGLDCALDPGDLQSLMSAAHPHTVKPDPDDFPNSFPVTVPAELTQPPQTDSKNHDAEANETEQGRASGSFKASNSSKTKISKTGKCPDTIMPSVITYGHTKPSVIVHGASVSSSVIVHSNQVKSGNDKTNCSAPLSSSQALHKSSPKSIKKQREHLEHHRKRSRDSSDTTDDGSKGRRDPDTGTKSSHKSRKSHSMKETSTSKQQPSTLDSQGKDAGPLCQITVRIGEEAIVKRSISETDLRRDKSHSPPKNKRSETSSGKEVKDSRHSHSHHHHKHRRASLDTQGDRSAEEKHEDRDVRQQYSPDAVREYYFRQEVREQPESDHDMEDNLWRPYYSYKPKRKAQAHLQRVKNWQRKLKFKRSLRLKKRADRLKNLAGKDAEKSKYEEEEELSDETGKISKAKKDRERKKKHDSLVSKERQIPKDKQTKEVHSETPAPPLSPSKSPQSTSAAPIAIKRRPWTNGNAAECGTCGRWFSSARKRDKHELSHLLEFVCLFCRATFPSTEKLEDHQKVQHPKPVESPSQLAATKVALSDPTEGARLKQVPAITKYDEDKGSQTVDHISSPSRLSRRALSRHTCPQCHKVCKTSSALNRHIRRHDLSSSPEREDKEDKDAEPKIQGVSRELQCASEQVPLVPATVSVINYSSTELQSTNERAFQNDLYTQPKEHKIIEDSLCTEPTQSDTEPTPQYDPSDNPIDLAPSKHEFPTATQNVLIMNGPECLDYRTHSKKSIDIHRPVQSPPNTRITTALPPLVSMATAPSSEAGYRNRDGVITGRDRQNGSGRYLHSSFEEPQLAHDLRVQPQTRCHSPNEAQDLTMSSLRAKEREEQQREKEREKQRAQQIRKQVLENHHALLPPKEEPVSPVPSPLRMPTPAAVNSNSVHRHTPKSPCRQPSAMGQPAECTRQPHSTHHELERATQPDEAAVTAERPSAHALPLPRAPQAPSDADNQDTSTDLQQVEDYPAQEYPLPLTVPDSYHTHKQQDDTLLMSSYPAGTIPFSPLGKVVVPNGGDLSKIPFYPDPYPLLYGPQLLAYPYNLAALPVALNMVAPGGDKVEPLPFLPAIFNYATGPYMGAAPHPLVANTSLYSSGNSGGKKQRDSSSKP